MNLWDLIQSILTIIVGLPALIGAGLLIFGLLLWREQQTPDTTPIDSVNEKEEQPATPEDYASLVQKGEKLTQEYRYKDALVAFLDALRLNDKDESLHYKIGRLHIHLEQLSLAERSLAKALQINPGLSECCYEYAKVSLKLSKAQQALDAIERFILQKPNATEGLRLKVRILLELQQTHKARGILQTLLEQCPQDGELLFLNAQLQEKMKLWDEALQTYQVLLNYEPQDPRNARYATAQILAAQERYEQAIVQLQQILDSGTGSLRKSQIKSELLGLMCKKGYKLVNSQQLGEAQTCFEYVLSQNANYQEGYFGLGKVAEAQGQIQKALQHYQEGLKHGGENAQIYLDIAALYEQLDNFDEALAMAQKAEALFPGAKVHFTMGTLYGLKGDIERCIMYLIRAINRNPDYIDAYYNLGVAYEHNRQLEDAHSMYKKVLDLDKDHFEAKANFKLLQARLQKW